MLVLAAKPNETIRLCVNGEVIDIVVVRLSNNHARIGIKADPKVTIRRECLLSEEEKATLPKTRVGK